MTIKELRKEKGLTQAAFAQSIGVSVPSIGGYEAGRIHPSAKVLDKIKEVYGLEIAADTSEKSKLNAKVCGGNHSLDAKERFPPVPQPQSARLPFMGRSLVSADLSANRTSATGGCPRFVPLQESNQGID